MPSLLWLLEDCACVDWETGPVPPRTGGLLKPPSSNGQDPRHTISGEQGFDTKIYQAEDKANTELVFLVGPL